MPFIPLSQEECNALPPEKRLAYLRAWDALQPRAAAAVPLDPPPSTPTALLAECERHRGRIVDAMREGQTRFYPGTDANFLAALKGKISGFVFPPLGRLFDAAVALDLGDVPPLPCEPRTGRDAVALLDALIDWCRTKQETPAADTKPIALGDAERRAWERYQEALKMKPELAGATDRDVYDFIRNAMLPGDDRRRRQLPLFETWSRYLRTARRVKGCPKRT